VAVPPWEQIQEFFKEGQMRGYGGWKLPSVLQGKDTVGIPPEAEEKCCSSVQM